MSNGLLTAELGSQWKTDGWCVIKGAFSGLELTSVQEAVGSLFPTADEMDSGGDDERTAPWRTGDARWPEFPFDDGALNHLVVHEALIDMAEDLLETDDVRLYQGTLTAKYSNQSSGYNRLLHTDYPNQDTRFDMPPRSEGSGTSEVHKIAEIVGPSTSFRITFVVDDIAEDCIDKLIGPRVDLIVSHVWIGARIVALRAGWWFSEWYIGHRGLPIEPGVATVPEGRLAGGQRAKVSRPIWMIRRSA